MTALDTNVLISLRSKDPTENQLAAKALSVASQKGSLCLCGIVYSELLGFPGRDSKEVRRFLLALDIEIDWQTEERDWELAGIAYQAYVNRRRTSGIGSSRRIATDFLIGAHALNRGYVLLTNDKGVYRTSFPSLKIQGY